MAIHYLVAWDVSVNKDSQTNAAIGVAIALFVGCLGIAKNLCDLSNAAIDVLQEVSVRRSDPTNDTPINAIGYPAGDGELLIFIVVCTQEGVGQ